MPYQVLHICDVACALVEIERGEVIWVIESKEDEVRDALSKLIPDASYNNCKRVSPDDANPE